MFAKSGGAGRRGSDGGCSRTRAAGVAAFWLMSGASKTVRALHLSELFEPEGAQPRLFAPPIRN